MLTSNGVLEKQTQSLNQAGRDFIVDHSGEDPTTSF